MELVYPVLHALIGWGATFSFIPVVGFTALGIVVNAVRQTRVPRFTNVLFMLVALALALYGVQPFLRTWYKFQDEREELGVTYQKLCVNRTSCRERTTEQCIQMELDLKQWPITLAFHRCIDDLLGAILTLRGFSMLGAVCLFVLGLSTVVVGGNMLQRRALRHYHVRRDAQLHELATGVKQKQLQ